MSQEDITASDIETQTRVFIDENYKYDEKVLDELVEEVSDETEITNRRILASFLIKRCVATAKEHGITKITEEDHPKYHVPTLIAAVKKIESEFPPEDRRMSLPQEIKILAVAEFANARNHASEGRIGIAAHVAGKAIQLEKYYEELRRIPKFDKYFQRVRG